MLQLFQDSMAICRAFQKPDLFITMTANPNWPEVKEALLQEEGVHGMPQTSADRPDIVARVFEAKKKALCKEIKDGIFGRAVAMVHTIEFQKRGLPHMHLLLFLHPEDKIRNAADVDSVVSACYDARSQYFPRSVTAHRFLFFLSFLDYIIDPRMA